MNTASHAMASAQPFSGAAPRQHGCHPLPLSAHSIRSRAHRTGHGVEQHHPDPIRLHMQELNCLSRSKAMLTANEADARLCPARSGSRTAGYCSAAIH